MANKRHGRKERTPQVGGCQGECEHSAAARARRDVQIVPVERMQIIGPQVESHIRYVETLVELNPLSRIFALTHATVPGDETLDRGSGLQLDREHEIAMRQRRE